MIRNNKKVVLIEPLDKRSYLNKKPFPPHSILHVAASISHRRDIIYEIVDYNIKQKVDSFLDDLNVFAFGITARTGESLLSAIKIAQKIKRARPEVPIIWGGIHVTSVPEESIKEPFVDIIVKGGCEEVFDQLLTALLLNNPLNKINNIIYKQKNKIINTQYKSINNFENFLPLPFMKIDLKKYNTDILFMNTSRGCPNKCEFCCNSSHLPQYQKMPIKIVVKYLGNYLQLLKPKLVFFSDYNFFFKKNRAIDIAQGIIKADYSIKWEAHIVASDACKLSKLEIDLLKESGCNFLITGQDAPEKLMKDIDKPCTYLDVENALENFKDTGIGLIINYIIGLPNETRDDLLSLVSDVKKRDKKYHQLLNMYIFYPWPGTRILNRIEKMGYNTPIGMKSWADVFLGSTDELIFHSKKHRNMVQTIFYVISLIKNRPVQPFSVIEIKNKNVFKKILYYYSQNLFNILAKFRWKFNFFHVGIEWGFLNFIAKLKHKKNIRKYNLLK